jgi:hypothetical protein
LPAKRERLEAFDVPPVQDGRCEWCGACVAQNLRYCGADCRTRYNNLLARQGKAVMQILKIWRSTYGQKGTKGAGMLAEVTKRVDAALREDRERKAAHADQS